jgi:CubicO group peptidase (beta-lactamase class C family)
MRTTNETRVQGHVEEGWGKVADAFRANFEGTPGEVGAACCVYVGGRPVVDLWGGLAHSEAKRPWNEDTIALVASTTKGATAICAHLLVQRGQLDLDAPVVKYWPEFGAAGKEQIPVRWLLSHQAGLPVVDGPLTFASRTPAPGIPSSAHSKRRSRSGRPAPNMSTTA